MKQVSDDKRYSRLVLCAATSKVKWQPGMCVVGLDIGNTGHVLDNAVIGLSYLFFASTCTV